MNKPLQASDLWADVQAVRTRAPLVHCITSLAAMNFSANVLLAAGASPVMAHGHEEVHDMVGNARSLVVNIGTPDPYWVQSMKLGLSAATVRGIPTVLDATGTGATLYRTKVLEDLLHVVNPSVIRGNSSQTMVTARALVQRTQGTVCVSGEVDHVLDAGKRLTRISNGHQGMTKIAGMGCAATVLIGAFCAVQSDAWRATTSAMALMGLAGQMAAEKAQAQGKGVGSMAALLLDELQLLDEARFMHGVRMEVGAWHA